MTLEQKAYAVLVRLLQESYDRTGVELRSLRVPRASLEDEPGAIGVPTLVAAFPYGTAPADAVQFLFEQLCVVGGQCLAAPTDG